MNTGCFQRVKPSPTGPFSIILHNDEKNLTHHDDREPIRAVERDATHEIVLKFEF